MAVVIKLKDTHAYFNRLSDSMMRGARRGLRKAGERCVQKIVAEIIPSRSPEPVDRGTYKAGWKTDVVDENTVAVLNPEAHAAIIEYGARAENIKIGTAMLTALSEWAIRKGIASDEEEALDVAWAIAKSMQKKGIFNNYKAGRGLHILGELIDSYAEDILREEVSREINRAIGEVR